jgi:hypothetical protein
MKIVMNSTKEKREVEGGEMRIAKGRKGRTGRDEFVPSDPQVAGQAERV